MPALPNDAILIADLVKLWPVAMPELRDAGEADRMNRLLGTLLDLMHRQGKVVPEMVYVTDAPPDVDRAALLAGDAKIEPAWFAAAYARWTNSPLFLHFWDSLTDEQRTGYFRLIPRA